VEGETQPEKRVNKERENCSTKVSVWARQLFHLKSYAGGTHAWNSEIGGTLIGSKRKKPNYPGTGKKPGELHRGRETNHQKHRARHDPRIAASRKESQGRVDRRAHERRGKSLLAEKSEYKYLREGKSMKEQS